MIHNYESFISFKSNFSAMIRKCNRLKPKSGVTHHVACYRCARCRLICFLRLLNRILVLGSLSKHLLTMNSIGLLLAVTEGGLILLSLPAPIRQKFKIAPNFHTIVWSGLHTPYFAASGGRLVQLVGAL